MTRAIDAKRGNGHPLYRVMPADLPGPDEGGPTCLGVILCPVFSFKYESPSSIPSTP